MLGATHDGGYYILGLKAAHAHLFRDITWSTEHAAGQTRQRAREIGLTLVELDPWYDIDDAASLEMLLAGDAGYDAPHTQAAIGQMMLRQRLQPEAAR